MIHKGFVQTVLGPVSPDSLGLTLPHEHVLVDMTMGASSAEELIQNGPVSAKFAASIPEAGWEKGEDGQGTSAPPGGPNGNNPSVWPITPTLHATSFTTAITRSPTSTT